jgi:glutaminase
MAFFENIEKIYNKLKNTKGGKNADYIKELSQVNPNLYAISIYTVDGEQFDIGDYKEPISIQSCSKIFTLALVLEKYGIKYIKENIHSNKSIAQFDSICEVDKQKNHSINPFVNAGAMATTSLLYNSNTVHFIKNIVNNMNKFADKKLHINNKIYNSEKSNNNRNLAIAHLLKDYNNFYGDVEKTVDVYTKQCSVMVTSEDIALMAATLANGGINPKSGLRIISKKNSDYIIHQMSISGLYNETDNWMKEVGFPAKSGVSGILLIVIPGVMGISIISPPLNKYGNSVKGIKTAKLLSKII